MRSIFLTSILALFTLLASAQEIRVIDAENAEAIERVLIHNSDGSSSILTNRNGKADLKIFNTEELIIFQHPSYKEKRLKKSELQGIYLIRLDRRIIELSEFVVSANKWEQDRTEVPTRIASLGPKEIRFQNTQTAADGLASTGEIFIQKSQLGGGSPMIRGFAANSVLIVVDGVRMNNAIFRSGNLQNVILIDPLTIDNAEVIFGPGSVIYGSDAMGGVMDFHTLQPALSYDTNSLINAEYFNRISSANQEFTSHLHINLGWKRFASFSSYTYSGFGDLRSGANHPEDYPDFGKREYFQAYWKGHDTLMLNDDPSVQTPSGYMQHNVSQKFRYRPNDNWDLLYNFTYSTTSDIPRYDRLIQWGDSLPRYAEWYYGPQEWMMHQLKAEHNKKTKTYDHLRLTLTRQDLKESRHDRKFNDPVIRHRTEKVRAYTLNIDATKKTSEAFELFYGLESVVNDVISNAEEYNQETGKFQDVATRYPDGSNLYYSMAAYVQNKYRASDKLILQGGLRYSHTGLQSEFNKNFLNLPYNEIEFDQGAFNGSIGAVFKAHNYINLRFSLSSGFRAPNLDDVAKVFDSEPGNVIVPNPGLRPEFAYTFDGGIDYRKNSINLKLDLFYTVVDNVMVREDFSFNGMDSIIYDGSLSKVQALVNAAEARIYGLSFNAYAEIGTNMSIRQTLTWTDGYEVEGNIPLRHTPPLFGRTNLSWEENIFSITAYAEYNAWKRWEDLAPSEQAKPYLYTADGSPAWYTLNFKGRVKISDNLNLSAGIENILDRHYRPYSSGISAPGRNVILSLRAVW